MADLKRWNFNTIGWVQDIVALHRMPYQTGCTHSYGYSYEDYEICDMPYCVNLEVAKIANWDPFPLYPDVFYKELTEPITEFNSRILAKYI